MKIWGLTKSPKYAHKDGDGLLDGSMHQTSFYFLQNHKKLQKWSLKDSRRLGLNKHYFRDDGKWPKPRDKVFKYGHNPKLVGLWCNTRYAVTSCLPRRDIHPDTRSTKSHATPLSISHHIIAYCFPEKNLLLTHLGHRMIHF